MPVSAVQLIANQNNAKKSTGPVTVQGKQTVSNNALKHGVFSKTLILTDEDPDEYKSLLDQLLQELHSSGYYKHPWVGIGHQNKRSETNQSGFSKAKTYQENEKNGELNHCQTPVKILQDYEQPFDYFYNSSILTTTTFSSTEAQFLRILS